MASQVGSQGLTINTGSAATSAAVNSYFTAQGWTNNDLVPTTKSSTGDGFVTYTDANTGEGVTMVGSSFSKGVFKIGKLLAPAAKSDEVVLGVGRNMEVKGTDAGNKITIADDANHVIKAGGGDDIIQNLGSGGGTFKGGAGNDTMIGGAGPETMYGGGGNDNLDGGAGNDTLYGNAGADTLKGGAGADQLIGGKGADVLTGGAGADVLTGGAGKDTFVYGNENTGVDVITDFKKGDELNLIAKKAAFVGTGVPFTIEQQGSDTVVIFNDGSGDAIRLNNVNASDLQDPDGDGIFTL